MVGFFNETKAWVTERRYVWVVKSSDFLPSSKRGKSRPSAESSDDECCVKLWADIPRWTPANRGRFFERGLWAKLLLVRGQARIQIQGWKSWSLSLSLFRALCSTIGSTFRTAGRESWNVRQPGAAYGVIGALPTLASCSELEISLPLAVRNVFSAESTLGRGQFGW